jgi:hypothetical protein
MDTATKISEIHIASWIMRYSKSHRAPCYCCHCQYCCWIQPQSPAQYICQPGTVIIVLGSAGCRGLKSVTYIWHCEIPMMATTNAEKRKWALRQTNLPVVSEFGRSCQRYIRQPGMVPLFQCCLLFWSGRASARWHTYGIVRYVWQNKHRKRRQTNGKQNTKAKQDKSNKTENRKSVLRQTNLPCW